MGITKVNKNLIGDSALDSDKIANNSIGSDEILDNTITNADISPQASISTSKLTWWCNRFIKWCWWICCNCITSRYK